MIVREFNYQNINFKYVVSAIETSKTKNLISSNFHVDMYIGDIVNILIPQKHINDSEYIKQILTQSYKFIDLFKDVCKKINILNIDVKNQTCKIYIHDRYQFYVDLDFSETSKQHASFINNCLSIRFNNYNYVFKKIEQKLLEMTLIKQKKFINSIIKIDNINTIISQKNINIEFKWLNRSYYHINRKKKIITINIQLLFLAKKYSIYFINMILNIIFNDLDYYKYVDEVVSKLKIEKWYDLYHNSFVREIRKHHTIPAWINKILPE